MESLERLVNEELAGVCFIRDYVEFVFDGPVVRAFGKPYVQSAEDADQSTEKRSRDALCELIGMRVCAVTMSVPHLIQLHFVQNVILCLPIDEKSRPESVHFVSRPDAPIEVW